MTPLQEEAHFRHLFAHWPGRAFKLLYTLHFKKLVRFSQRFTRHRKASEDIVQEALCLLWEKREEWTVRKDLLVLPYLKTIIRYKSISYFRTTIRYAREYNDMDLLPAQESEDGLSDKVKRLWQLVAVIPPREKQCMVMRLELQMSYQEIAADLGVTVKAVERTLTSARKRLIQYKTSFRD